MIPSTHTCLSKAETPHKQLILIFPAGTSFTRIDIDRGASESPPRLFTFSDGTIAYELSWHHAAFNGWMRFTLYGSGAGRLLSFYR